MKRYRNLIGAAALGFVAAAGAQTKGVVPPPWVLFNPEHDKSTDGGSGRIYTAPDSSATGGIEGRVEGIQLGMCMAIESPTLAADSAHLRVYRAVPTVTDKGSEFKFSGVQIGKYDLVLIDRKRHMYEGLKLGEDTLSKFPHASQTNLTARIGVADSYFNQFKVHRVGIFQRDVGGDTAVTAYALVERISTRGILKQSGEAFNGWQRRLEVMWLNQASDTWQMDLTRHFYRLGEPKEDKPPFLQDCFNADLSGIRVVDSIRSLGTIKLSSN